MDRIDPHEHPVGRMELLAYLVGKRLVIDRRLGIDADSGKLLEDPEKTIILLCRGASGLGITAPENCDTVGSASVHATLLAWRVAQSLDGRLTGCLLDPGAMLSACQSADNHHLADGYSVRQPSPQSADRGEGGGARR